jgi:deoxyguanosine kinase
LNKNNAYIGLGSNVGDRRGYIDEAIKRLSVSGNIKVIRTSDYIETAALGNTQQPPYINVVTQIETSLDAHGLHRVLIDIEDSLGRKRTEKWADRTIDLDILLFDDEIINDAILTVPHSQMHLRSFVMRGLSQLDAGLQHPVLKVSAAELARRLNGCDFFISGDKPRLIGIAGNIGAGKTTLAKKLTGLLAGRIILEPYDTNPFLPQVYAGKKELALDSQLFFLTHRAYQLDKKSLESGRVYISDYVFEKEIIYAQTLLESHQLALYQQIYPPFAGMVAAPVLVIYLEDSAESCLERIARRGRPYEQKIDLQFLRKLDNGYRMLFADWKQSPLIRISTKQLDYTNKAVIEHLTNQIRHYIFMSQVVA